MRRLKSRRRPPRSDRSTGGWRCSDRKECRVTALVISEVQIRDEALATRYRELAASSISAHGGRDLARGVLPIAAEGEWPDDRLLVVVAFDSLSQVHHWYGSPEYAPALEISRRALFRRLLFVELSGT
jgi:uncharacterized protein (DUF1330 family)